MSLRYGEMHFVPTQFRRRRALNQHAYIGWRVALQSTLLRVQTTRQTSTNFVTSVEPTHLFVFTTPVFPLCTDGIRGLTNIPRCYSEGTRCTNPVFNRMTTERYMNGILPSSTTGNRSQWPRGLRRGSAAACLLRLWARIPPGAWTSVSCERCVLSGRGLCDEPITNPEESCRLWCVVCDLETSWIRRS